MKNKKVLILVPAVTARGGITNYYQVLKQEFAARIEYFERGSRTWPYRKGALSELLRAFKDYLLFKKRLSQNDIGLVQTTTSLGFNTIIRDGMFIRYAGKRGVKTLVFFRGWDDSATQKVEKKYFKLFKFFFSGVDKFITLSQKAKTDLQKWGFNQDISVETTLVDKKLLEEVDEFSIVEKYACMKNTCNLLFLSRVERRKGIYELLEAFKVLSKNIGLVGKINLSICGDGMELDRVERWIQSENLTNIRLQGFVSGDAKKKAFDNAHLFIFPSYGEGMPNAVLEAMGFGLPVVSTPVGGVVDFFSPGKNGYYISIGDVHDIVVKIKKLLHDKGALSAMALHNYRLAQDCFRSDKVAKRMELIFDQTMNG